MKDLRDLKDLTIPEEHGGVARRHRHVHHASWQLEPAGSAIFLL